MEVREMPAPQPEKGQELVRVHAGGINFADVMTMQGGYAGAPDPPLVAGREFAGIREHDGAQVMGYTQWGAFAGMVAAQADLLWPVPAGWSMEEAAAFPVNYFTALLGYWRAGLVDLEDGRSSGTLKHTQQPRVLIQAVAGGVGTAAVQIGKLLGVEMWGTSSSGEKLARVQELGLQHGINYRESDYENVVREQTGGEGVDAVFEMLGGEHVAKGVRCLRQFGSVVVYGSTGGEKPVLDTRLLYAKATSVKGLWLTYLSRNRALMDLAWKRLRTWMDEGQLHPVVGSVVPLEDAADAYRSMMNRGNFGKTVLQIAK